MFAESIDYHNYEPKIERLLNTYVQAEKIQTVVPLIPIYDDKFKKALKDKQPQSQGLMIIHSAQKYISENIEKDRAFYEKLSKLLQNTLDEYRTGRINEKELLQKAKQLKDQALARTGDPLPPALENKAEAKAFFGILKKVLAPKNNFDPRVAGDTVSVPLRDSPSCNKITKHKNRILAREQELNKINLTTLAEMSIEISKIIKKHCVVDWVRNQDIQNKIKNEIDDYLFEQQNKQGLSIDISDMDRIIEESIKTAKSHYVVRHG